MQAFKVGIQKPSEIIQAALRSQIEESKMRLRTLSICSC